MKTCLPGKVTEGEGGPHGDNSSVIAMGLHAKLKENEGSPQDLCLEHTASERENGQNTYTHTTLAGIVQSILWLETTENTLDMGEL